jgi:hypothetical protein
MMLTVKNDLNRGAVAMTRGFVSSLTLGGTLLLASAAQAGILFEQPPANYFGAGSDTHYVGQFHPDFWQLAADDFTLPATSTIRHVTWWAFYGGLPDHSNQPPQQDEYIRLRIYQDRPSGGLPGSILYEETFLNAPRAATGRFVFVFSEPLEYKFDVDLATPFDAVAGATYWLEVAQLDIFESLFRWQTSTNTAGQFAFLNPDVADWTATPGANLAFQLSSIPEPSGVGIAVLCVGWYGCLARKQRRWSTA